jgi:hypothetical protein
MAVPNQADTEYGSADNRNRCGAPQRGHSLNEDRHAAEGHDGTRGAAKRDPIYPKTAAVVRGVFHGVNTSPSKCVTLTIWIHPRGRVGRARFLVGGLRALTVRTRFLRGAWLTNGYSSGRSMDSTARSTSRSGQYR